MLYQDSQWTLNCQHLRPGKCAPAVGRLKQQDPFKSMKELPCHAEMDTAHNRCWAVPHVRKIGSRLPTTRLSQPELFNRAWCCSTAIGT